MVALTDRRVCVRVRQTKKSRQKQGWVSPCDSLNCANAEMLSSLWAESLRLLEGTSEWGERGKRSCCGEFIQSVSFLLMSFSVRHNAHVLPTLRICPSFQEHCRKNNRDVIRPSVCQFIDFQPQNKLVLTSSGVDLGPLVSACSSPSRSTFRLN